MSTDQTTPALASPAPLSHISRLNDFSDKLPPMLVKELRQGLRARSFVAVFLGLQLFLGLVMLFATAATSVNGAGEVVSRIIFLFFSIAVLSVQPLRAINAMHGEIKNTTIDLMVLTRLSARRIVFGKWAAIVGQSALLFISIIPYLILRYFFGGMNLFAELLALFSIFLFSACLTAINVGVSANSAIIVRALLPLGIAVGTLFGSFGICMENDFKDLLNFFTLEREWSATIYFSTVLSSLYIAWTAFGLAVSTIAPASENHSTLNRIITLVVMAVAGLIFWISKVELFAVPFMIGLLALPGILLGLTEKNFIMPRLTIPFLRRGFLGRFAGLFLYPGLSAGIMYALLLSLIIFAIGLMAYLENNGLTSYDQFDDDVFASLGIAVSSVLFPAIFLCMFQKRIQNQLGMYIAIFVSSFALMAAVSAIAESTNSESAAWVFAWLPPMQFYLLAQNYGDRDTIMILAGITNLLLLMYLFFAALRFRSSVIEAEQEALLTCFEPGKTTPPAVEPQN